MNQDTKAFYATGMLLAARLISSGAEAKDVIKAAEDLLEKAFI